MIYGVIAFPLLEEKSPPDNTKLKENLEWDGCLSNNFSWGNLSGGYLYNKNQPFCENDFVFSSEINGYIVLITGVIYNREEIVTRLGSTKKYSGDPELILESFNKWGVSFVKELNGDFTIVIYSKQSADFYIFSDHMGIRPIYYCIINEMIWFSSDAIALCKTLYVNEGIDRRYILNCCVKFGLSSTPLLLDYFPVPNHNVKRVLPGHYIEFSKNKKVQIKYWRPENSKKDKDLTFDTAVKQLKNLVNDSVRIRCDSRFVAAAHVSSGLDSSLVAALVRKNYYFQKTFLGFSWSPKGDYIENIEYDERELICELGEKCDFTPVFISSNKVTWDENFKDWRNMSDFYSENIVRKTAKSNRINLLFSGWGGDEFFSINNIGLDSEMFFKFHWKSFFSAHSLTSPKKIASILFYHIFLPAFSLRFYTSKRHLKKYSDYFYEDTIEKFRSINDLYHWKSRHDMHKNYLYNYHIPQRTQDWYVSGCRDGIEYRYPLIDRRIVEFMFKIPYKLFLTKKFDRIFIREVGKELLTPQILKNTSKNDPIRYVWFEEIMKDIYNFNLLNINEFANNPDFSFINFDKLKRDIALYQQKEIPELPETARELLIFLKKMNEFHIGYNA